MYFLNQKGQPRNQVSENNMSKSIYYQNGYDDFVQDKEANPPVMAEDRADYWDGWYQADEDLYVETMDHKSFGC